MNPATPRSDYGGSAFHHRERLFGKISLDANAVTFEARGVRVSLPLKGLRVTAGGANHRMLFFTHASYPEWTICTSDPAILNDGSLASTDGLGDQVARIRGIRNRAIGVFVAMLLLLSGGIYGLFILKEPLVTAMARGVPPAWERQLGDAAFSRLVAGKRVIDDPAAKEMMARITAPLLDSLPRDRYPFTIHMVEDPTINAVALPGGRIVIHTGLIKGAGSVEEVAGVIAHEAAHITLRHGLRNAIGAVGTFALVQALFGDTTGLLAVLTENSALLITRKYSRDYERAADDEGWTYLTEARINPRGMIEFFERLLKNSEDAAKGKATVSVLESFDFLSTHPSTRERIERLRKRQRQFTPPTPYLQFDLDFTAFQNAVGHGGS